MNETREFTQEQIDTEPGWKIPGVSIPGNYRWSEQCNSYEFVGSGHTEVENIGDFDTGLGIGGLGRQQAPRRIPTTTEIERRQKMQDEATYCNSCGQSDLHHGAMFTTLHDVCDDCA